ncbi:DUF6602 domain-containing protein [Pseudarthrobacter quantipunctorum]|uniref:DUF6602 domain-containing protein n=1 Tax=Pseudarthrobacter quantipunctorum TaxID=3128980 RepID=A0ABZ2R700_9MICC
MSDLQNDTKDASDDKKQREHELQTFLRQDLVEIESEYERIYSRSTEDPGTAGDEGEENWKALLEQWLPNSYKVVTKGRIIGVDGKASPQVDVIVLRPSYPERLLNKKLYLVHGVAAVFECKTTVTAKHIREATETAAKISALSGPRTGTPYRELTSPPLYGLLAHSHSWKKEGSTPRENIDEYLTEGQQQAKHPRDLINVVCVADLAIWELGIMPYMGGIYSGVEWRGQNNLYGLPEEGGALTMYQRWHEDSGQPEANPLAVLIAMLFQRLGWEDPELRPLADYFRLAGLQGASQAMTHPWPLFDVYTPDLAAQLQAGALVNGSAWNEWTMYLP